MQPFNFYLPTRIAFGQGRLAQAGAELTALGAKKPLVVTDPQIAGQPFFQTLTQSIKDAGLNSVLFDQTPVDPDLSDVDALAKLMKDEGCDSVVAIGGGSALCAGRGAAMAFSSKKSARELVGLNKVPCASVPVAAIPTTAGSGAEVSSVIVLSDSQNQAVVSVASPYCFPALAILDPDTLANLPEPLAAASGMDALAHGLEALMTTTPSPVAESLAVHACATLIDDLRRAALTREPGPKARCLVASTMANMACGNAHLGLGHAMILPLTARLGMPHGVAGGLLIPHVVAFNMPVAQERLFPVLGALGYDAECDAGCLVDELSELLADLSYLNYELPQVDDDLLMEMAKQAAASPLANFNLRTAKPEQVYAIYRAMFMDQ